MIYAEIEYAPLPVTAKYAALQSNTAPDNNAASLSTCQSSKHLTPHRLRGGCWSLGPPRPRRAFRPPRSPDAVVGWCDHQRRPQWANTEAPLPRWGTGLQFRVRRRLVMSLSRRRPTCVYSGCAPAASASRTPDRSRRPRVDAPKPQPPRPPARSRRSPPPPDAAATPRATRAHIPDMMPLTRHAPAATRTTPALPNLRQSHFR